MAAINPHRMLSCLKKRTSGNLTIYDNCCVMVTIVRRLKQRHKHTHTQVNCHCCVVGGQVCHCLIFPFPSFNIFWGMALVLAILSILKRKKSKLQNMAVTTTAAEAFEPWNVSCRRSVATELKCDIKLVGSATSRRKNSNYFFSLLFLWMLLLPSLLCASCHFFYFIF